VALSFCDRGDREQITLPEKAFHRWALPDGTEWTQFHRHGSGYLLRFPGFADFEVSADGSSVQGWGVPGIGQATVQHLYLNQVLPLALSRQGKLVLHASAVKLGNLGVAFIGASGRGKSTLAASFATTGTSFLTDDGLQLEPEGASFAMLPSHPSIRLWGDSQQAVVGPGARTAPPLDYTQKTRLLAGPDIAFYPSAAPLGAVFYLGCGTARMPVIERLSPAAALDQLAKNSFLLDGSETQALTHRFDGLCRLAALPIHFRLDYRRHYADLPLVREAIAAALAQEDLLR
jgi:hypothetical protein